MRYEGSNGSVELLEDRIVIRRKGIANMLTQGLQGDKEIPLSSIMAVHFKDAGKWMAGLIQFTIMGGREFRGGMLEATKDENAVLFERKQQPSFEQLRDEIRSRIIKPASASVGGNASDELTKLAVLVEKGFLTREEFDKRKAELLR